MEAMMSSSDASSQTATGPSSSGVALKLEVAVIPVSDVDRAKAFYQGLGWRLDADFSSGEDFRVVQLTRLPGREWGEEVRDVLPR
jgi:hypothetical protein